MDKKPLYISSFAVILFLLGIFFLISPPFSFPESGALIDIKEGKGLRGVSYELKEKKVIRSRIAFEAFVIIYGGERHVREGYYMFEKGVPVFEAARRISSGDRHIVPVKITIPEGFASSEIAEVFASKLPGFDKERFLSLSASKEGYLFPDTYFFFPGEKADEVFERLTENYEKKMETFRQSILRSGRTEKEIITMASLLEKEAKGDSDRKIIAGILWKRMAEGMPLQADAAPETYERKGLPEQPIANPGALSIGAALEPEPSPYLFYLHDKDGNTHYAKTYAEHKKNISKYLK